jgi:urea transport system substrate-binding protein
MNNHKLLSWRSWYGPLAAATLAAAALTAQAADTIKVGVLHSLSGTMAISETTLKDTDADAHRRAEQEGRPARQEARGGRRRPGLELAAVRREGPRADQKDKVAAVFGCWTSVSRKSVLPVFEELNGILFYPVQYEGEESSRNVFYTGAAPNQQAIPAVDYLMKDRRREALGAGRHRLRLSAHHQQDPRSLPEVQGRQGRRHHDQLHAVRPFRLADIVADIKKFGSAGKKTAVVSTINGDANVPFYKELGNQGIKATDIPVVAFSVGEEELAGIDTKPLVGHLAAWNYFMSVEDAGQRRLHQEVAGLHQESEARDQRPDGSARTSASTCG